MPAPVRSRSSLTRAAVISAMEYSFQKGRARLARRTPARMAGRQVKGMTGTARTLAAPSRHARRRSGVALAFGFGSRFGRDLFIFGHRSGVDSRRDRKSTRLNSSH